VDAPFVGHRHDHPHPLFRVDRDLFAGYFVVVRPINDNLKPFWLAKALTNPNPNPRHIHFIQINIGRMFQVITSI